MQKRSNEVPKNFETNSTRLLLSTRQCASVVAKRKNAAIPFVAFYVVAV
jgi:hypothetical protein